MEWPKYRYEDEELDIEEEKKRVLDRLAELIKKESSREAVYQQNGVGLGSNTFDMFVGFVGKATTEMRLLRGRIESLEGLVREYVKWDKGRAYTQNLEDHWYEGELDKPDTEGIRESEYWVPREERDEQ